MFLPEYAPAEWSDRAVLWNAVEENEKTKDSRLAREFVAALPVELNRDEWIALLTEFIQKQFVEDGMCVDVCIHDTDGHNTHAHIMLTVRPLDEKGKWQYKAEADNALLRELKAQVRKLMQAVRNTVPALAEAMEALRGKLIISRYQLLRSQSGKWRITNNLAILRPDYERYIGIVGKIKDKNAERKTLLAEKKATPVLQMRKHKNLSARIAELTEELEELRSQKAMLLRELSCRDDSEIGGVQKDVADMAASLSALGEQEKKCAAELNDALKQYAELKEQAKDLDPDELLAARLALRPERERSAASRLQAAYGDEFKAVTLYDSKLDVRDMLGERAERPRKAIDLQQKRGTKHRERER